MAAQKQQNYFTPREYLQWERQADTRSEYHDGVIVAMSGASRVHNRITFDTGRALGNQLAGQACEPFESDMRVLVPDCNRYFYPDLVIVCGEAQFEDAELDTLLNPALIIETLSDSTERTDRRLKLDCYRTLPTLQTYVLIAQDEPRIETFTRQTGGTWRHEAVTGLDAVLPLPAIRCTLRLADVYARVSFAPAPNAGTIQADDEATRTDTDPSP